MSKPDPAALIHRFGALVDRLERTGVSAGRSREKADARGASIGLANYDEEEAFRQASADVRAAYAAALQPQPSADDWKARAEAALIPKTTYGDHRDIRPDIDALQPQGPMLAMPRIEITETIKHPDGITEQRGKWYGLGIVQETPLQPGADDAAALDKLVDLWDAACGDLATGPHVAAYREHRAAVLARMSVPEGYKLVPKILGTEMPEWKCSDTSQSYWDKCLARFAAPTEVK